MSSYFSPGAIVSRGASLSWVDYRRQQDRKWRHLRKKNVPERKVLTVILCVILLLLHETGLHAVLYHRHLKTVLSTGGEMRFFSLLFTAFFPGMTMSVMYEFPSVLFVIRPLFRRSNPALIFLGSVVLGPYHHLDRFESLPVVGGVVLR